MSKEVKYPEFVGGNVTSEQAQKIKESNLSTSEFIRNAIDFYDEIRLQSNMQYKISVVEECIQVLKVYETNLKNQYFQTFKIFDNDIKNEDENSVNLKGGHEIIYKENEENLKVSGENLEGGLNLKGQTFKGSPKNIKGQDNTNDLKGYEPILDTVIRLIANKGHLSQSDYEFQASRIDKTSRDLKKFIREHHDELQKEADKYR